jgi:hypothetical protein
MTTLKPHAISTVFAISRWPFCCASSKMAALLYISSIYLHTPWSRVLLENLTGPQLVKKFATFYGTPRFIIAFTNASHLSES